MMGVCRVRPVLLPLLAVLLGGLVSPRASRAQEEAEPDRPPVEVVFSPHEDLRGAIVDEILRATDSIDMALYSIAAESDWVERPERPETDGLSSDERRRRWAAYHRQREAWEAFRDRVERGDVPIHDALREALRRGVRCRLILNRADADPWNYRFARAYDAIGLPVWIPERVMHEKFAIVDGEVLITGSGNWSVGAITRYSENTLFFRDHPELVDRFRFQFDRLLEGSRRWDPDLPEPTSEEDAGE